MQQGAYVLHQVFALLFGFRFLSIATGTGIMRRLFQAAMPVLLLVMLGVVLLPPAVMAISIRVETIAIILLLFCAAASAVNQGYRPARYYLIGWSGLSLAKGDAVAKGLDLRCRIGDDLPQALIGIQLRVGSTLTPNGAPVLPTSSTSGNQFPLDQATLTAIGGRPMLRGWWELKTTAVG